MRRPGYPVAHRVAALGLAASLCSTARAQEQPALEAVGQIVKPGQTVVVTDRNGVSVKGTIGEVAADSLVIRVPPRLRAPDTSGLRGLADTHVFAAADVREIRTVDGVLNGTLIGTAVAAVPAIAFTLYFNALCANEGGRNCTALGVITPTLFFLGTGAAVGASIDARTGGAVVYTAPGSARELRLAPILTPQRQGLALSFCL
jgi:hypothetical protein